MPIIESVSKIDRECVGLCDAINLYAPKIRTTESCCGHGERPYKIWLRVTDEGLADLPKILYWIDTCHSGTPHWWCEVYTDCGMSPVSFKIQGPIGQRAYDDAAHIADLIQGAFDNER